MIEYYVEYFIVVPVTLKFKLCVHRYRSIDVPSTYFDKPKVILNSRISAGKLIVVHPILMIIWVHNWHDS